MYTNILYNNDKINQSYLLLLSIIYIYFLSDLFIIINEGPSLILTFKLSLPIISNFIYILEKYSNTFYQWWNTKISYYITTKYVFQIIQWLYDNKIHKTWNYFTYFGLHIFFFIIFCKIIYNYIYIFNFNKFYLFCAFISSYGVYKRFRTSKTALITLSGKSIEMGMSMFISDKLYLIDKCKNYCNKNKNTWITHIIKIIIGYCSNSNYDGEVMAIELSNYLGTSINECDELYKKSTVKKILNIYN